MYISHMRVSTMENAQGHHQDSLAACTCVCVCACARVSGNREKLPKSSDSSLLNICVPTIAYTAVAIIRTPNAFTTGLNDRTCQQCVYESLRMQRGCVCVCTRYCVLSVYGLHLRLHNNEIIKRSSCRFLGTQTDCRVSCVVRALCLCTYKVWWFTDRLWMEIMSKVPSLL